MRWLFPVWFEEADHWDEAKLRLCPSGLVRPQLAKGFGAGVHRREALAGWHVALWDEPDGSCPQASLQGLHGHEAGTHQALLISGSATRNSPIWPFSTSKKT